MGKTKVEDWTNGIEPLNIKMYKVKLQMNITTHRNKKQKKNTKERYSITIPLELINKLKWKKQNEIIIMNHDNSLLVIKNDY